MYCLINQPVFHVLIVT